MNKHVRYFASFLGLWIVCTSSAAEKTNPYIGRWALTLPGGGAGWLGVTQENSYLDASLLWGSGSVLPVDSVYMDGDTLVITRLNKVEHKDAEGKVVRTQTFTETITAKVSGDTLQLTQIEPRPDGTGVNRNEFPGKRIGPIPPKPDLSKIRYGKPITLFNGTSLEGWTLIDPKQQNGWSAENGLLANKAVEPAGGPHIYYGNLRTVAEFEDFNLKLEVNVPEHGNSGVYLRGVYEVQVADTYGDPVDSHNMGAIYGRIAPHVSAEKPAGEWQTLDITLVDRHATVKLNGVLIIDNEPLVGCTGGALWADELRPGPIYLQGDHTSITYRNLVLTPVVK
jgi:hypothetical protein